MAPQTAPFYFVRPGYSPYTGKKPENGSNAAPARIDLFPWYSLDRQGNNTFHTARQRRLKICYFAPRNPAAAPRYFDYESAVALRNLTTAYGTGMPRYLLAPEVAGLPAR